MLCVASSRFQPAHVSVRLAVCSTNWAVICSADDGTFANRQTVFYFTPCARKRTLVVLAGTDARILTAFHGFEVVTISLTPSVNKPFTSFGGSIEEVTWNITKARSSSRGEITHAWPNVFNSQSADVLWFACLHLQLAFVAVIAPIRATDRCKLFSAYLRTLTLCFSILISTANGHGKLALFTRVF